MFHKDRTGRYTGRFGKFLKHYIYPFAIQDTTKLPYNTSGYFFDSYYGDRPITDGATISPTAYPPAVKLHYAATEVSVIKALAPSIDSLYDMRSDLQILDIGSGAGHWIDFYLSVFPECHVVGTDNSEACYRHLLDKYRDEPRVSIFKKAAPGFSGAGSIKFNIVNAIGVMFHIIKDSEAENTVYHFHGLLRDRGKVIVGGHFGLITRSIQFHRWSDGSILVDKRVRSRFWWRRVTKHIGLKRLKIVRTPSVRTLRVPENNILLLEKSK
jgi:hypothetical protein